MLAKDIIILGIILVIAGLVMQFTNGMSLPKLPGDIYIKKDNFVFYFPITSSIIISIILSIVYYIFFRR